MTAHACRDRRLLADLPARRAPSPAPPHNVVVVTTTYGKTLAIDADSGRILWTFTPPGYGSWAGSAQITVASPLADPDRRVRVRDLAERADPQALARQRQRGPPGRLAGERHARRHAREARRGAQHRRSRPGRGHQRLLRRRPALPGPRGADRSRERPHRACLQHALREPPRADRPEQLLRERLGDPLAQRRGRRARRQAPAARHRQRPLERDHRTSATA